jgi:hypothetical protein
MGSSWVPSKLDKVNFKGREKQFKLNFHITMDGGREGKEGGKKNSQSMILGFLLLGRREGEGENFHKA